MTTPKILFPAARQYRHNNKEGLLNGYDKEETDKIVILLIEKIDVQNKFIVQIHSCLKGLSL